MGVGVGHGQEGVVGFGVADADPGAVPGERADGDALVEAGRGEVQGVLAQASVGGTTQPSAISASRTRVRSLTVRSTRSNSSSSAASEATAAACAMLFTLNGSMTVRTAAATGSCAIMKPVRRPARP